MSCEIVIINYTTRNKPEWSLNQNTIISFEENTFKDMVCKMSTILFRPQRATTHRLSLPYIICNHKPVEWDAANTFAVPGIKFSNICAIWGCVHLSEAIACINMMMSWASCQIRKITDCACARNAGNVFGWRLRPPTNIRRDGCGGRQYTLLHSHRLLVVGWQWGW